MYCLAFNDYDISPQSDLDGVINNYNEPPQFNLDGSQLDPDDTSNPLQGTLGNPSALSPPPDSKPSNNELIAQSVTGVIWDGIVAPAARGTWTALLQALSWGVAGASALKHEVFDQSTAAKEERARFLESAIETVRKQGCRAACWGFEYCGFGPLGPTMFPGVYVSVWNVCKSYCFLYFPNGVFFNRKLARIERQLLTDMYVCREKGSLDPVLVPNLPPSAPHLQCTAAPR